MFKHSLRIGAILLCLSPSVAVLASPNNNVETHPSTTANFPSKTKNPPTHLSQKAQDLQVQENQMPELEASPPDPSTSNPDNSTPNTSTPDPPTKSAQTETVPAKQPAPLEQQSNDEKNYILPPRVADKKRILPLTTTLPLNGVPVSHLTQWQGGVGYEFGPDRADQALVDGTYQASGKVLHSITKDNVFVSKQTGTFFQLKSVQDKNTVSITRSDPVSVLGFQQQLSFVGSCDALDTGEEISPGSLCSFLPAVVTDRDSIDPDTLQPTRFNQLGEFGEVLSPETVAALREPGFLGTAPNGQTVGIDLFFPRTGESPGNSFGDDSDLRRFQDSDKTLAGGVYRVNQTFKSNHEKAVIGRTVHGLTGIGSKRNLEVNLASQVLPQILPTVNPKLKGSDKPPNSSININLFRSANHTRIPSDSWVIYQAGLGHAKHKEQGKKKPKAQFNSVWLGLSPVADRSFTRTTRINALGPHRLKQSKGTESDIGSGTSFISLIDDDLINRSFSSQDLSQFYTEIYLSFFETDAEILTTDTIEETFTFYPHISLSGNISDEKEVLRYYGGMIISPDEKFYAGVDYTRNFGKNWEASASVIGYTNPDPDYFSRVETRISKSIFSNRQAALKVSSNFRYVLDRPSGELVDASDAILNDPVDDSLSLNISGRLGPVSAGITQFFNMGDSFVPTSTGGRVSLDLGKNLSLSGYVTPNNNLLTYGSLLRLRLNRSQNSPSLLLGWDRTNLKFNNRSDNRDLSTSEDRFLIRFQMGHPANPL